MNKNIIVLAFVFLVLISGLIFKTLNYDKSDNEELLFPSYEVLSKTSEIEIKNNSKKVILKLLENKWKVKNKDNFDADFEKVSDLIEKLQSINSIHSFAKTQNLLKDLELDPEDKTKKPTIVNFKDKNNNIIFQGFYGKEREKGGSYFLISGNKKIHLSKNTIFIDPHPKTWVLNDLININDEEITKVVVFDSKSKKVLEIKNLEEEFEVVYPENIKDFDKWKIKDFFNFPQSLDFNDIEKEKTNEKEIFRFEFYLETSGKIIISVLDKDKKLISIYTDETKDSKLNYDTKKNNYVFSILDYDFNMLLFSPEDLITED